MVMVDVNRIREQMEQELGECNLSDGELEDMYTEELQAKSSSATDSATLDVLKSMVKKLDKMSGSGVGAVDVRIDSEPIRKVCDALAFSVSSMNDRVEKGLKKNDEIFAEVAKNLLTVAEKVMEVATRQQTINVAPPQVEFKHFDQLNKSLSVIAGRESPAPRIKVASPTINIDMDPVAKSICDMATMLGGRAPQVIVEPSIGLAPIIHVHLPRIKKAEQIVIRDNQNQIIGAEWNYEYAEDDK